MAAAGDEARKRKKLEDDFTPRLEFTVVALQGTVHREVTTEAQYRFDDALAYASRLTVVPRTGECIDSPELGHCDSTGKVAPKECLAHCAMTGVGVLRHLLVASKVSGRQALPEHTLNCSLSGKRILMDEAEFSAVRGRPVASSFSRPARSPGRAGAFRALRL